MSLKSEQWSRYRICWCEWIVGALRRWCMTMVGLKRISPYLQQLERLHQTSVDLHMKPGDFPHCQHGSYYNYKTDGKQKKIFSLTNLVCYNLIRFSYFFNLFSGLNTYRVIDNVLAKSGSGMHLEESHIYIHGEIS